MTNKFDEFKEAVQEAKNTFDAADHMATEMARILVGRLSKVRSDYVLGQLKKELKDFNIHTGRWMR